MEKETEHGIWEWGRARDEGELCKGGENEQEKNEEQIPIEIEAFRMYT